MRPPRTTTEFKVDVIWKVVIFGAFALASRMSWLAWETSQSQIAQNSVTLQRLATIAETSEIRLRYLEQLAAKHDGLIDSMRWTPPNK